MPRAGASSAAPRPSAARAVRPDETTIRVEPRDLFGEGSPGDSPQRRRSYYYDDDAPPGGMDPQQRDTAPLGGDSRNMDPRDTAPFGGDSPGFGRPASSRGVPGAPAARRLSEDHALDWIDGSVYQTSTIHAYAEQGGVVSDGRYAVTK